MFSMSLSVPMIEPVMVSWSAMTGRRFSGTSNPVVPPSVTSVPPRASDDRLCAQESDPDVIDDGRHLPGQRLIGGKALVGAERPGPRSTFFRAARCPDLEAGGPTELDQRGRHAAGRALDQHRLAGPESRLGEQRTVGGQPGRAEDRGVQGRKILGQRDRVSPRHDGVVGEGAVDELAGDVPLGIERLVTTPVIAAHHRVDDDRRAVIQSAGRVVAQDDWDR